MNAPLRREALAAPDLDAWLAASQRKSLLRFITCGSVDDGKSTLIGRLLYDSRQLLDDQLAALHADSRKSGTGALDLASLVDGLAAEREQGITIDVAYRFFATDRRKFIVADTPGHEQYTRNMVTGASNADLAVILIDARKGVLTQTRRHSYLVHLLGIRNLVLAINKMDLVGNDQDRFDSIIADYRAFAREAGIGTFTAIPVSGLNGDNVASRSAAMPWYRGPSLLEHLETVSVAPRAAGQEPFAMAVQWVNRPNQNFRGYAGRVASGRIRVGAPIAVLPAGSRSSVARIVTFDGDRDEAVAGQSVTLVLADDVDCSRGDVIADAETAPPSTTRIESVLVWMSEEAMVPHRSYWLKIGTQSVSATISGMGPVIDVNTMEQRRGMTLALNDIGQVEIDLDRRVPAVRYQDNRRLGGFILIDKLTHATVAAGLVRDFAETVLRPGDNGGDEQTRILWINGATPDSVAAYAAAEAGRLKALGRPAFVLDESALGGLAAGLEGAPAKAESIRHAREVAKLMSRAGVHVLVTVEASEAEAHPGRRVDAGSPGEKGADEWVI